MLLLGVLAALLAAGLWMYALIDILLSHATDCRRLTKGVWLAIAAFGFVPGAVAWLVLGRPYATSSRYIPARAQRSPWLNRPRPDLLGPDAEAALRRHPAGRARYEMADQDDTLDMADAVPATWPTGPDDDPDFLSYLDQVVAEIRDSGGGA